MIDLFYAYRPLFDFILINCGLALSQYIVLRAGVFSLASAGFAAIGAYTAAILTMRAGVGLWLGLFIALLAGGLAGAILAVPLARLRGIFQAIATLAFVQIVMSLNLYAEPITGGAAGLTAIPRLAETWHIFAFLACLIYVFISINRNGMGRVFDTLRQDEAVAVSLAISVTRYQTLCFIMSGAIAGVMGAFMAYRNYAITPDDFGFPMLVGILVFVVLGGRSTIVGPLVGAVIMTILPELARPLAEYRTLIQGAVLILVMIYFQEGLVDTAIFKLRNILRKRKPAPQPKEVRHVA